MSGNNQSFMREIKFRACDTKENKMVDLADGYEMMIMADDSIKLKKEGMSINSRYVLMQFTGLLDKNGREIYEGDILTGGLIMKWGDATDNDYGDQSYGYPVPKKTAEIIGNIYQNPELYENK
jgi:uncharacterized phage protein (TIGR01671 family)